jgi:integrase
MDRTINFTKDALSKLPLPESGKRVVFHDAKTTGLQIRITANGTKTFSLYRRIKGGQPERITLGKFPDMTIEQARRLAAKVNSEIEEGANPAQAKRAIRESPTLAEFFDNEYGPRHGENLRTWKKYKSQFDRYIRPFLGKIKLSLVTREQVARIASGVVISGKSNSLANKIRNQISGIYRQAIEWEFVKTNPASGIKTRKEKSRNRFLQRTELPRFFSAVAAEENPDIRDYILLSLLTGGRKSNVVAMRWAEIDFDECLWYIQRTKNDDPQSVPLSSEAMAILNSRKDNHSPWVFPGKGKSGHLVEPKSGWRRVLDRDQIAQLQQRILEAGENFEWPALLTKPAGHRGRKLETVEQTLKRAIDTATRLKIDIAETRLPDLRLHDLRRTLGSWQAKTGASLVVIGKSLNHKSPMSTMIYAQLDVDPVRQSINTATTAMFEAAGATLPAPKNKEKNDA